MPSARVLAVDDDEELLQLLSETLVRDGFRVVTAASAKVALERAAASSFDLVISDVQMPVTSGIDLRDAWHRLAGHADTPFLFVSAMNPVVETEIASRLGRDRLLSKPFTRAELRRAVYAALKLARVTVGPIATTLGRIFTEAGDQQSTGVLTAVSGPVTKRVVLQEGRAVFAFSNDPRDLIGQAFLRAGLISESELLEAFALWESHPGARGTPGLATALAAMKKVTPEQSRAVFERKIREAILDLFLWRDGMAEFVEGEIADDERPFPVTLDVRTLLRDGERRRRHWDAANAIVPDRSMRLQRTGASWPEGFPATEGERSLVRQIEAGRTLAEILVEFRGQDYGIVMRIADLVTRKILEPRKGAGFSGFSEDSGAHAVDVSDEFEAMFGELGDELDTSAKPATEPVAPPPPPEAARAPDEPTPLTEPQREAERRNALRFADALVKMRSGDLQGARKGFLEVLATDPFNTLARERLEQTEAAITSAARRGGLEDEHRLKLAVPIQSLVGRDIPPNDAFVLSRLAAGALTVGNLLRICPFPEHAVLEIVVRHLGSGVLKRDV